VPFISSDGSTELDGAIELGPGLYGALPSGYCCNGDSECRDRNCISFGGTKMCADACEGAGSNPTCDGLLPGFQCVVDDSGIYGQCEPIATSAACVPASRYAHGTKPQGACCSATHNATAGTECAGGHCGSFGVNNPFICINDCNTGADCPGNYECTLADTYKICMPLSDPYTCP
jgi:hypothetical protein